MKISIIAVGRISNSFEAELVNRYINRFNKLNKLIGLSLMQVIEVDDKKYKTKKQQAKKILEIMLKKEILILGINLHLHVYLQDYRMEQK